MLKSIAEEIIQSPKAGHVVAMTTTTTGVGTILDLIPDDIGKLATLCGIVLTVVLVYVHIQRWRLDKEKYQIERQLLQEKLSKEQKK